MLMITDIICSAVSRVFFFVVCSLFAREIFIRERERDRVREKESSREGNMNKEEMSIKTLAQIRRVMHKNNEIRVERNRIYFKR